MLLIYVFVCEMVFGVWVFWVCCEYEIFEEDGGKRWNGVFVDLKCRYYSEDSFGLDELEDVGRIVGVGFEWYFGVERGEEIVDEIVERILRE